MCGHLQCKLCVVDDFCWLAIAVVGMGWGSEGSPLSEHPVKTAKVVADQGVLWFYVLMALWQDS